MKSFIYDLRKYAKFSQNELRNMLLATVVMAFIISFNDWGQDSFSVVTGLTNLVLSFIIVGISLALHLIAQKAVGLGVSFKVEYSMWWYGLGIGLILAFLFQGSVWFLASGGILVYHMAGHRLGAFRYGINYWPLGVVGFTGPLTNLVLAILTKILLAAFPGSMFLQTLFHFNLAFAVFSMLPIPPLDGSHLFFASRIFYVFMLAVVVAMALFLYLFNIIPALISAVIVGAVCWFMYLWLVEL